MKCAWSVLRPFSISFALALFSLASAAAQTKPNIVLIYADDLGYGDVGCYGAKRLATPNIDRLAKEGLRFTDAHSPSATCTPSRYAMLTGEYAWRRKGTGVLPGNAKLIIEPDRVTMASVLKKAGYTTGVVGKWHLGLGSSEPDWNGDIKPGPLELGFDSAFIMAATGDRVPCVFIEDHRVVGLDPKDPIQVSYSKPIGDWPTGKQNPDLLKMHPSHGHDQTIVNGISRIGYMTGGKAALWKDEDLPDVFLRRALAFLEKSKSAPFFLFYATHEPHVPRVPHPRFVGRSGLGPRGDAIVQLDWSVGEVLKTLDRLKLAGRTLVIFTSDNGPVVDDGYRDDAVTKLGEHSPSGPWRAGKYNIFEGGTRVPFIVRWLGRVQPGVSDALICQVDFVATFAALTGQTFNVPTAPDSENILSALLGDSPKGRELLIEHAAEGLALRQGLWKLIERRPDPIRRANANTENPNRPAALLYDLATDPGETKNVAAENTEKVTALRALLEKEREKAGDTFRDAATDKSQEKPKEK